MPGQAPAAGAVILLFRLILLKIFRQVLSACRRPAATPSG
jgi:hypothetical protein